MGCKTDKIVLPFFLQNIHSLWADSLPFQKMRTGFPGTLDNYFPQDELLSALPLLKLTLSSFANPSNVPLPQVAIAFTGANGTNFGLIIPMPYSKEITHMQLNPGSVQM